MRSRRAQTTRKARAATSVWKTQRGPRARLFVPRDSGLRSRVVSGAAGAGRGRGGRGEGFGRPAFNARWAGGTLAVCASKITTASWRVRSGGRAGRRTWGGQRQTGFGALR